MPILSSFVSGFQKYHFYVGKLKMQKKWRFKKWRHHPYLFWDNCTAKNKDVALKFSMWDVCMYFDNIYSGVLDSLKILDFMGNYFRKSTRWFWALKSKNIKNPRYSFCRVINCMSFDTFQLCVSSKLYILSAFNSLPFFTQTGETWRH